MNFQVKPLRRRDNRGENEKFERRMLDELSKIWDDSNNFYFSTSGDLTNTQQRQWILQQKEELTLKERPDYKPPPLWKKLDHRFFWNHHMLQDVIAHDVNTNFIMGAFQNLILAQSPVL